MDKIKHLGDVTKINGAEITPVDVITFGSPCQDLSVAGKRAGLKHSELGDEETTRSGLFMEAVRIIKEMRDADIRNGRTDVNIRPRFAVWENVPGAFSSNGGEDFRAVLEELLRVKDSRACIPQLEGGWSNFGSVLGEGISVAWRVLDAQYWGVPQRRRRIFLVADFGGECANQILFERNGLQGYPSQSGKAGQGITDNPQESLGETSDVIAIENRPNDARFNISEDGVIQTLTSRMGTGGGNEPMVYCKSRRAKDPDDYTTWKEAEVTNTLNAFDIGEKRCNELVVTDAVGFDPGASRDVGQYVLNDTANTLTIGSCPGHHNGVAMRVAGFCPEEGSKASGIGYQEECSPTLRGTNTPAVVENVKSYGCNIGATIRLPSDYIWEEVCPTLRTEAGDNKASVITNKDVKAFSFDSVASNSMKSPNPNSGCREVDVAKTLDTSIPEPSKNQGGMAICEPITCIEGNGSRPSHQGDGYKESDVMYTLNATEQHAVCYSVENNIQEPIVYQRGYGGNTTEDGICSTLTCTKDGSPVICINQQGGADVDVSVEKSGTLTAATMSSGNNKICVAEPVGVDCYNLCETGDKGRTLCTPSGGLNEHIPCVAEPIVLQSNQNQAMITQDGISPTLCAAMGMGGGYVPMITEKSKPISFNGNIGSVEVDKTPTITGQHNSTVSDTTQLVAEPTFSSSKASFFTLATEEVANTLVATDYKDPPIINDTDKDEYIVRRLTPLECTRLQGFPDHWLEIGEWVDTNGKRHDVTDGAKYKALGNSVAIPCVRYVLEGIAMLGAKTLGSLFDGISGFPLSGMFHGIYPEWSSEIEEFPIAVIKYHFGDYATGQKGDLDEWLEVLRRRAYES